MKVKVDKKNDALYFRLDESKIVESEEIEDGIILDYDNNNNVVGIEILGVTKRLSIEKLSKMEFEVA